MRVRVGREREACALHASWFCVAQTPLSVCRIRNSRLRVRAVALRLTQQQAAVASLHQQQYQLCQLRIIIQYANKLQKSYCCYVAAALTFPRTRPRSPHHDARYQLLGRKPKYLALSTSNRTVSACVATVMTRRSTFFMTATPLSSQLQYNIKCPS
jgi:hypothetical protein